MPDCLSFLDAALPEAQPSGSVGVIAILVVIMAVAAFLIARRLRKKD